MLPLMHMLTWLMSNLLLWSPKSTWLVILIVGGLNIGSSHHVCYVRAMFKTYTNKKVLLEVAHTTNVVGIEEVEQSPPLKNL